MVELQGIFIQNLKKERGRLGISQLVLAERSELSPGYIGEIESGRKFPSIDNVERIARALEVPPYRLYMTDLDMERLLLKDQMPALSRVRREALAREVAEILNRYAGEKG